MTTTPAMIIPGQVLRAGALETLFDPATGALRYLHVGAHEVLRGISAPVRGRAWETVPPEIAGLEIEQAADGFQVRFEARCRQGEIDFRWRGRITARAEGALEYDFEGEALRDFERCRIGFCILHGAPLAGQSCTVEHVDGRGEAGCFPASIQGTAPFLDLRAIAHEVAPGLRAEVRMEGDAFEMEDQRNWGDASFKTFCTPLRLPRPVRVTRGTRVRQNITVRLLGRAEAAPAAFSPPWSAPPEVRLDVGAPLAAALPRLGVVWAEPAVVPATLAALRALPLSHLRVDVRLRDPGAVAKFACAADATRALGLRLEAALFVDCETHAIGERAHRLIAAAAPSVPMARWLLLPEADEAIRPDAIAALRAALAGTPHGAAIGVGATDNFTELNRHAEVARGGDFPVYATNPQVHATDEASIIETLAMHETMAIAAGRLAGKAPVVSPITLARRWRIGEDGAPAGDAPYLLPFQADQRHASAFCAAWALGSLAAHTRGSTAACTYFETSGANGLLDPAGAPRPVHAMFASLRGWRDATPFATTSSHRWSVDGLALEAGRRRAVALANFRGVPQRVRVTGAWGEHVVTLAPHATAIVRCD
ncbi:MAG: hypothetical protein JNL39_20820 [Opitutaceae bacterium]|nr:hypothetical protein [Opitutaceae bacterium]